MADDSGALGGCVLLAGGPVQRKPRLVLKIILTLVQEIID